MDAQTQANEIAKLDVGLVQLFTEYRVSPEVMAMCGAAGVDSVSTLAHHADDKAQFRGAFTLVVGLDPNTGPKAVWMAHVVGSFSALKTVFTAEPLTMLTTILQADVAASGRANLGAG